MKKKQKIMKKYANKLRKDEVFIVEEEVLLLINDFDLSQYSSKPSRKLD
jgi:hypothetical protein